MWWHQILDFLKLRVYRQEKRGAELKSLEATNPRFGPCAGTSQGSAQLVIVFKSKILTIPSCYRSDQTEVLCVTDWGNRALSFHLPNGKPVSNKQSFNRLVSIHMHVKRTVESQMRNERQLNFNACRIVPYRHAGGDYLLICGSNKQSQLFSSEGYPLGTVAESTKWVWSTAAKPNSTIVVSLLT